MNQAAPGARRQDASATLKSAEYNGSRGNAVNVSNQNAMTPQLYSQNRGKHQIGTIPTTMNNTFVMSNGTVPLSNSMMAPQPQNQV
jgi:hypothetical protein